MNPGQMTRSDASMTEAPLAALRSPTAAILPAAIPTSAAKPGLPRPSTTVPLRMMMSNEGSAP